MKNATTISFERDQKEYAEINLEARFKRFFEQWAPEDPNARNRFDYDLITIIRTIYAEASAPANAQLLAVMERLPLADPIFGPKDLNI